MEVKLVVVGGKHAGQALPVKGPKFFIGRSEECQLRAASDLVSRHHAVILLEEGYVGIRDFGSKNGTVVNGARISSERELKNGDRLKIGPLEFEVQLTVAVGGQKKPKVHSVHEAAVRSVQAAAEDDLDILGMLDEAPGGSTTVGRMADTQPMAAAPTIGPETPAPEAPETPGQTPHQKKDDKKPRLPAVSPSRHRARTVAPRQTRCSGSCSAGSIDASLMKASRPEPNSAALLGLAFDAADGHTRITRGQNFYLLGGSQETHAVMQETAVKVNEHLDRKGKRLEEVSVRELRDIIHKVVDEG